MENRFKLIDLVPMGITVEFRADLVTDEATGFTYNRNPQYLVTIDTFGGACDVNELPFEDRDDAVRHVVNTILDRNFPYDFDSLPEEFQTAYELTGENETANIAVRQFLTMILNVMIDTETYGS